MLCLITRPDSVVLEVEVDPKANGEDILNKVSELTSLGCESYSIIHINT